MPHDWSLHKLVEIGEVGRLTGTLRQVEDRLARLKPGQDASYLYKQRDTILHMLDEMGVDVKKMKANAPKKQRVKAQTGPFHREAKPIPREPRLQAMSLDTGLRPYSGRTAGKPNPGNLRGRWCRECLTCCSRNSSAPTTSPTPSPSPYTEMGTCDCRSDEVCPAKNEYCTAV